MFSERQHLLLLLLPSFLLLLLLLEHLSGPLRPPGHLALQHSILSPGRDSPGRTSCNTTVVTAYYRIHSKHSHEQYIAWMVNFLSMTDCLVVFVQPELEALVRAQRPPGYPTLMIPRPLDRAMVAGLLGSRGWEQQESLDPESMNRELYWVWNEKTHMLHLAAQLDTFTSSYFLWLDIGAIRKDSHNNHQQLVRVTPSQPGVLLLSVLPFTDQEKTLGSQADFTHVDRIGGGTIGADKSSLGRWHTAYYATLSSYIAGGRFMGKDQSVMATTCLQEPGLCLLVKGDGHNWFLLQEVLRGDKKLEYITTIVSNITTSPT